MTEIANFSEAWNAYLNQHKNPPKDANQLHKYSKANKEIADITYPIARLQYEFNKKVLQSASNDACGDTNDITAELERLQKQFGKNYAPLLERDFFEFGKIYNDKTRLKIMQFNVCLDVLIGKQNQKQNEEKSDEKEISADNWQYRGFRIIEIIRNNDPDIITIQELNHFMFISHYLKPLGYDGVFKLNTKSKYLEGVAVFYKSEYFDKLTTFMYGKDVEKGTKFDLYALTLVLKHKNSDKNVVVCSCNLDYKDKTVSRMNKLIHLTSSLKAISSSYNNGAIFIGCDLGSDQRGNEYYSIKYGQQFLKENKEIPKDYEEGYGLKLESAYYPSFYKGKARSSEPKSTIFAGNARDYIFFDKGQGVTCSNILELPTDKEINQYKVYPNSQSPSTHQPLMAQIFF